MQDASSVAWALTTLLYGHPSTSTQTRIREQMCCPNAYSPAYLPRMLELFFSRSRLNAQLDWQTRFIKILAFKTADGAGISELI
jgi:hypothetical protein